jgi:hypothetical protein
VKPPPTHPAVHPQTSATVVQFAQSISLVMLAAGMLIAGVYLALGFDPTMDAPSVGDSPPSNQYGSFGLPVASPISVVLPPYPTFPSVMTIVTQVPTPTVIVPTMIPSPSPFLCPDNPAVLPQGSICQGPPAPLPTPIPPPSCQSTPVPGVTCVVRNSLVKE